MRASIQSGLLLAASLSTSVVEAERVLGAYIYARHGDRTAKVLGNTQLTNLGYREVFDAGSFYHDRYVAAGSDKQIEGISPVIVNPAQISASSPTDAVLQNSATGFLQGVYPPAGSSANQTLANGTTVDSPLQGYQLIQIAATSSSNSNEGQTWLQGSSECNKATVSSNNYYVSTAYETMLQSTKSFYQSLSPLINSTFSPSQMSFKNAYSIFDYLNVGRIHNSSAEASANQATYDQLLQLANNQQYNLAYNASDPVRAIAGAVLAGEILSSFNETIASGGKSKLAISFGSYGTFLSFFGLVQLPAASVDFTGLPDYASSMAFELVTNATGTGMPAQDELSVRFMFHNGTLTEGAQPTVWPLFGQTKDLLSWSDFKSGLEKVAVSSDAQWCDLCGNTDGKCASSTTSSAQATTTSSPSSNGMSRAVAGVVGAMVTLAVILGLEALFFLVGGFRISRRNKNRAEVVTVNDTASVEKR
ncbi:Uncharacterized protein PECH_006171 [Penicillium ucsense]|uniref:Histidine acid phosphatase n=1 Tax=Penicillium ucsense TaxID=2839758 RepID=A0A8J8WLY7_9EURO|nr:Uncharacterized protein PECM_002594 [Penicillium ucsense]KAF7735818.1 Uncharacterized protein PECH_006171 [Penicillium ucsense]